MFMDALENSSPVINIVFALTQIEVSNGYRDHFFDFGIRLSFFDVFGDHFRSAIKHSMEVVVLFAVLYFYYDYSMINGEDRLIQNRVVVQVDISNNTHKVFWKFKT